MATELTWLGHGTWLIETAGQRVLLDPFLTDSPTAPVKAHLVAADCLLLSHGHYDHTADAVAIAQRTGALVIANFEICQWLEKQGVTNTQAMNLGGTFDAPFGKVKMTLAHHSSSLPDGSYGGNPCGFLLTLEGKRVYFACDTALFLDMKLIGASGIDLAVVPIGDNYTMGPDDAIEATRLINPKRVVPSHYDTWPPIEQDALTWSERIKVHTSATPIVLEAGGKIAL